MLQSVEKTNTQQSCECKMHNTLGLRKVFMLWNIFFCLMADGFFWGGGVLGCKAAVGSFYRVTIPLH